MTDEFRRAYSEAVAHFTGSPDLYEALKYKRPKVCTEAAMAINRLCSNLGTDPRSMGQILLLPPDADFRSASLALTLKSQPEALYRFALLREAALSIEAKCGDMETGRIWWHAANGGSLFAGQPPMRYLLRGNRETLLMINQAILGA